MKKPVISGNTISIPSDLNYLSTVDDFIEGILRGFGVDESVIADIAISVSELLNNSINHGNQSDDDKPVVVSIDRSGKDVSITITDRGTGYNPTEIADPLAEENLLKNTGRGLFIVKSLMDKVEVITKGESTSTTITKTIA